MSAQKRKAILLGLLGLVLIIIGIKYLPYFLAVVGQQSEILDKPVILFFSMDDPCECMIDLTEGAEQQMANWPVEQRSGIPVVRIALHMRDDLQVKYMVFRAPSLVLINDQDQVAWRQDYPLIEGGPFDLAELEAAIAELGAK
jgi:hypothetical protein